MVMHLACVTMRMSMPEALNAATINAAYALGEAEKHGSLEIGKYGNMVVLNADRLVNFWYTVFNYFMGINTLRKKFCPE